MGTDRISARYATIGGGLGNTASNGYATVGGGYGNTASGIAATVPGGGGNNASGNYSFAAGKGSIAGTGSFVWTCVDCSPVSSTANNQFLIGATGGVGINTNLTPDPVDLSTPGGGYGFVQSNGTITVGTWLGAGSGGANGGWYGTKSNHPLYFFTNNGSAQVTLDTSGNIGIGTTSPAYKLDVNGKVHASGGFNGQCLSAGSFSGSGGNSCNMDVAEGFASTELTTPGDLVALVTSSNGAPTVRKSTNAYDELLIGVVSQNPGLVFDNGQTHLAGDNSQLITNDKTIVALVGRVQVKVSIENSIINIGDPLTSSSTPGVAMKATHAGKIIGYAMEATNTDGKILALVQPGDYVPPAQLHALKQNAQLDARVATLEQAQSQPQWVSLLIAFGAGMMAMLFYRSHRTAR